MDGVEDAFEAAIRSRINGGDVFHYMEIGTAYWHTFKAVVDILKSTDANWWATGIDPSDESKEWFARTFPKGFSPRAAHVPVSAEDAFKSKHPLPINFMHPVNFAFIDGCHALPCVRHDFLAVEKICCPGGLVVLHDFGEDSSGFQPHCQLPLGVRKAAEELGLLDGTRPGWKRLADWVGDKSKNGATCGVFERL